jgi:hypothetical protein
MPRPLVAGALALLSAAPLGAQERLIERGAIVFAPIFESWQLADGIRQGAGGARIERATQWSVPVALTFAAGDRWTLDLSTAYANGTVSFDREDAQLGEREVTLAGLSDVRVRAVGRFLDERVLLTVGAVAPTGKTELAPDELSALRVLSAPALSFQTPLLGGGAGATVGIVLARPVGDWAVAAGGSYEYRGRYTPATVVAGIPTPDFSPGAIAHLSLGADGLLGAHGATIAASLDLFGSDRVQVSEVPGTRLGPVATVEARLDLATTSFREVTLYAVDRYRSAFERGGETVEESAGNYLDAGIRTVYPLGPRTGLLTGLNFRHQTGLGFDESIQTAAIASGALTLGITRSFANGMELAPFARAQVGTLESGDESTGVRGVAAGVTLTRRF